MDCVLIDHQKRRRFTRWTVLFLYYMEKMAPAIIQCHVIPGQGWRFIWEKHPHSMCRLSTEYCKTNKIGLMEMTVPVLICLQQHRGGYRWCDVILTAHIQGNLCWSTHAHGARQTKFLASASSS